MRLTVSDHGYPRLDDVVYTLWAPPYDEFPAAAFVLCVQRADLDFVLPFLHLAHVPRHEQFGVGLQVVTDLVQPLQCTVPFLFREPHRIPIVL